jgi:hypothetical protein
VPQRLILAALVLASASVAAGPRAVVADDDATLRAAIAESLRPWLIEVVAEPLAPPDREAATIQAADHGARYVIWREHGELVVLDLERGELARRPAPEGALDPVAAAAAALTVKTMLRLPEPGSGPPPVVIAPVVIAPPRDDMELRMTASSGARFEYGLDGNLALRFGASLELRPWRERGWRFSVIGDLGAPAGVDQAGFHGEWWNWGALVGASWTHASGAWELGPWLAAGLEHSSLEGTEGTMDRREEALSPALRGGGSVRCRFDDLTVGFQLSVETLLRRTTYTKLDGPAQVFEIPPIGAVLSFVIGYDFPI